MTNAAAPSRIELYTACMWYASQMYRQLVENEAKGTWKDDALANLLLHLKEEVQEVQDLLANSLFGPDEMDAECADIGNLAMMIADVYRLRRGADAEA